MTTVPSSPAQTPELVSLREDLIVSRVARAGVRLAVIKDPLAHRFFEMPEDDYLMAALLDERLALRPTLARLQREGPPSCREADERGLAHRVQRLCAELRACGLVRGGAAPNPEAASRSTHHDLARHLRLVASLLFVRVPLGSPARLLDKLQLLCEPFFHPFFLTCAAVFTLLSAAVFVWSGGPASFEAGWFASWQALLAFYVGLVLLKVFHEAAHAVVVRHYGGQVHEAGMILVAGLPLFYVEASDSYLLPQKSRRIAVAAAGIVAELVLAAVMVWLWLFMADGFARQLVLNLLLVASVSTVLFNGNPLMRFDGYYILAEAIDKPNLRERSKEFVASRIGDLLLGTESAAVPRREAWLLGAYGVLSQAYLVLVILAIWRFLSVLAQPQGLQWLANLLVGAWALGSLVLPFGRFCAGLARRAFALRGEGAKRVVLGLGAAVALLAALIFIPLPHWVSRSCVLQPAGESVVRCAVDGFVADVLVAEGDTVSRDQPLARLRNRTIESGIASAKLDLARSETALRGALTGGSLSDIGQAKAALAASTARLEQLRREADMLVLRAPCHGVIATSDMAQLVGKLLKAGDVFCVIQAPDGNEFLIPLDERQARQVRVGARVRLRLRSQPWKVFHGKVSDDPLRLDPKELPPGLLLSSGGDVAVSSAGDRQQTLLADTHFAKVRVNDPDPSLKIGMTGRVRIECGRPSLASRAIGALADFVRLDVRMQ